MRYLKQFILTAILFLTGSISFAQDNLPVSGQIAEHEYVDLGLPSGTLWATCNVGATKPTEYGDYFAWGETEPKEVYADSTYKWFNADSKIFTKYNSEDGLKTLLPEDDAATANWGSEWRMPTNEEQRELVEECQYQMTEVNGVYGAKFTGKNGNSVFFPAAGGRVGTGLVSVGYFGVYWSYSLREKDEDYARNLGIGEKNVYWGEGDRGKGYSVRAVANKTTDIEEYVVSFYTQDSVLIESQKVEKGKSATAVDAPVVDGYEFIGWSDSSFTNVMKDLDIYAQYKAITKDTLPVSGQIAGHDYIDLGLPSGTLWATYNVGATTPEEYGDYFAWGETSPKENYSWTTYKWCNGSYDTQTKYCTDSDHGTVDNKTVLEAADDAATANWGSEWRMPTNEEQRELVEEWQYQMTEVNGVYGAKFTGKNGNSVFFPAAGYPIGSGVYYEGYNGYYWSSSLDEEYEYGARLLNFLEEDVRWRYSGYRDDGFSVRAVANKATTSDDPTNTSNIISNVALQVYADNGSIHVANAQPNTKILVFDMNGKTVASGATDAEGSAEIRLSASKGVYVVSDGNQSTKVVVE